MLDFAFVFWNKLSILVFFNLQPAISIENLGFKKKSLFCNDISKNSGEGNSGVHPSPETGEKITNPVRINFTQTLKDSQKFIVTKKTFNQERAEV